MTLTLITVSAKSIQTSKFASKKYEHQKWKNCNSSSSTTVLKISFQLMPIFKPLCLDSFKIGNVYFELRISFHSFFNISDYFFMSRLGLFHWRQNQKSSLQNFFHSGAE
jgi:hypothetical protein